MPGLVSMGCTGTCLYLRCPGTGALKVTQLKQEAEMAAQLKEKCIVGKKEGVLGARLLKETSLPEGCESKSGYWIGNWLLW